MKKTKIIRKKSKDGPFKKVNQLFLEGIQTKRYGGLFHVTDYKCNERPYNVMLPGIHCILHPELLVDLDAV